ncbi:MAG: DUF359 domain-containing protein [Nitrososphaeria archaeon]
MYRLTDHLREELKKPLGILVKKGKEADYIKKNLLNKDFVITVGDRTTESFVLAGGKPKLEIVDLKEMRSTRVKTETAAEEIIKVRNEAGTISDEAIEVIKNSLNSPKRIRIEIDGEEDLLGIPCIIYAPEGSYVLYGQPNEGLVVVRVDRNMKDKANAILLSMEKVQN